MQDQNDGAEAQLSQTAQVDLRSLRSGEDAGSRGKTTEGLRSFGDVKKAIPKGVAFFVERNYVTVSVSVGKADAGCW